METLYKRTKTGAIQQWSIEVLRDGQYQVKAGQLGGKLTTHLKQAKAKNVGKKNETSLPEQAHLEAQSEWRAKHDEGYKTSEELGIGHVKEGVHRGVLTLHGAPQIPAKSLAEVLDLALPKFNTDASGNVKPMLASPIKDWAKVKFPARIDPKYDGVRCLMVVDFTKPQPITFLSRSGKEYTTLGHIREEVMASKDILPAKFILDGEIYSHEITFQEIVQAVKKQYPNSLKLRFRAYDIVTEDQQLARTDVAEFLVAAIESSLVIMTEHTRVKSKEEAIAYHDAKVGQGYEGAMIREDRGIYAQGQRSRNMWKVKEFDEGEFPLLRFEQGERPEDLIAVIQVGTAGIVKPTMMGSRQIKAALVAEYGIGKPIKGKKLTVKYFGLTDDGLLRHPNGKGIRDYE